MKSTLPFAVAGALALALCSAPGHAASPVVANAEANLVIAREKLGITEGDCEAALLDRRSS